MRGLIAAVLMMGNAVCAVNCFASGYSQIGAISCIAVVVCFVDYAAWRFDA